MNKAGWSSILFATLVLVFGVAAEAQQPAKVPRIGYLATSPLGASARIEAFRQGLRELGYVEGKNIVIESRYAEGKSDRLPTLAAELVRLKVDVILSAGPRHPCCQGSYFYDSHCHGGSWRSCCLRVRRQPGAAQWKHHRVDQHCSAVFGNRDLGRYEGFCVDVYVSP